MLPEELNAKKPLQVNIRSRHSVIWNKLKVTQYIACCFLGYQLYLITLSLLVMAGFLSEIFRV